MDCGLLYSAGKDSTLAALLLEDFFDVTLVSGSFGIDEDVIENGRTAAEAVGLPFEALELDREVAEAAVERMVADGYPSEGIRSVHEHALERLADDGAFEAVADGTRQDDRAPTVDRPLAQSLEDRFDVEYVSAAGRLREGCYRPPRRGAPGRRVGSQRVSSQGRLRDGASRADGRRVRGERGRRRLPRAHPVPGRRASVTVARDSTRLALRTRSPAFLRDVITVRYGDRPAEVSSTGQNVAGEIPAEEPDAVTDEATVRTTTSNSNAPSGSLVGLRSGSVP